jgi:hypothetical protein
MYKRNEQPLSTVDEALWKNTVDQLKKFLPLISASEKLTRKADLVALISRHLYGGFLRDLWEQLDDLQRAAVAETVHSWEARFYPDRFEAKYGQQPDWGTGSKWEYKYKPSLLCLFIYDDVMPHELRRQLMAFVPEPEKTVLNIAGEIPEVFNLPWKRFNSKTGKYDSGIQKIPIMRHPMERSALHDLQAVLRLTDLGKVQVNNKTRQATSSTIEIIASALEGGDYYDQPYQSNREYDYEEDEMGYIKAFAWPMLVQAAGLAELSGKRLSLTRAGKKALALQPSEVIRAIWRQWIKTKIFDEFRRIDCIEGQTSTGRHGFTAADKRRDVIASALRDCPIGEWVKVDDFFRYMRAADFSFEVHRAPENLYISDSYYGNLGYSDSHGWNILQARYALCFLFEYASTLGIIDVAYVPPAGARNDYSDLWGADDMDFFSRYDGLLYFRLTPLGAYCLNLVTTYTPAPLENTELRVSPDLKVEITGKRLPPADALLLDTYAEKVSGSVWRIDEARLMGAFEDGHKISELQEFLQARSGEPLPAAVRNFLDDAAKRARYLQDRGPARLIECVDTALASLIANDPKTRRFCFLAGDRYIVVPSRDESEFRRALKALRYVYQIKNQ